MPTIASGFRLANNVKIPCIGLGTWQVPDDEKLIEHIHDAINIGYRHIDTAFIYGNEAGVGEAIRTCGVPREKIFVTTKLWNADRGYDAAMRAFDNALQKMDLSYLDMFLIHWPAAKGEPMTWQSINSGTWRALEDLYEQGVVRAIGVSTSCRIISCRCSREPALHRWSTRSNFTPATVRQARSTSVRAATFRSLPGHLWRAVPLCATR